jgi:uncharacterized protein
MSYKLSQYNILVDAKDVCLLFNTLRGSLARIDNDKKDMVKKLLNTKKIMKSENGDLFDKFALGGFIIPAEFDELTYLKLSYFKAKFSTDLFQLVVIVTKECNFECIYCCENTDSTERFTEQRMDTLVKFIEPKVKRAKLMTVSWFGGEPLLTFDVIDKLTKGFISLCDMYSCKYIANVVTNGYLLTPDVSHNLPALKIERINVTLDGPRDIHNKRRMLKGGGKTYDVIISNIRYIINNNIPVAIGIRCNVDNENVDYLKDWLETFPSDLKSKVTFGFSRVIPGGEENCPGHTRKKSSMNTVDSEAIIPDLMDYALDKNFVLDLDIRSKNVYCNHELSNYVVIGPDLSQIACSFVMNKIGQISGNGSADVDLHKYVNWQSKDPFNLRIIE